jgi:predicted aspartyl protease
MGTFKKNIILACGESKFEGDFLVDTGALHTWMPERILKQLGVTPRSEVAFMIADGSVEKKKIGFCEILLDGKWLPCPVVFGPDDAPFLLGATTLEIFGVGVDPVNKMLISVVASAA